MNHRPTVHAIRKGAGYDAMVEDGVGCILRRAKCDGIRVATEAGDVVVPLTELEGELAKLWYRLVPARKGKAKR